MKNSTGRKTALWAGAALVAVLAILATFTAWDISQAQSPPPVVGFEFMNYSADEPDVPGEISQFEVGVVLSQASNNPVTVNYATTSVQAKPFEDYHDTSGTLTFPPNTTRQVFFVDILGDDLTENVDRFTLELSNPTGATLGSRKDGQITITDTTPNGIASLEIVEPITEGSEAGPVLVIHRTRTSDFVYSFIVKTIAFPGGPTPGADYQQISQTVHLPAYTFSHVTNISPRAIDDNKKEAPERFYVFLLLNGNQEHVTLHEDDYARAVWIIDDDIPPGLHVTTNDDEVTYSVRKRHLQVLEGSSEQYKIWLAQPPTEDVTIGTELWGQDQDITLDSPISHTFTPDNWYEPYWITVNAAQDDDTLDGYRRINHTIETTDPVYQDHHPRWVTAQEMDDDLDDDGWNITSDPVSGVVNGITAEFEYTPKRHDWDPFLIRIKFSERVTTSYRKMRDHALSVTAGEVLRAYRTGGKSDDWTFEIGVHEGESPMTITLQGGRSCNQQGAVCASGGRKLANTLTLTLQPPE